MDENGKAGSLYGDSANPLDGSPHLCAIENAGNAISPIRFNSENGFGN